MAAKNILRGDNGGGSEVGQLHGVLCGSGGSVVDGQ